MAFSVKVIQDSAEKPEAEIIDNRGVKQGFERVTVTFDENPKNFGQIVRNLGGKVLYDYKTLNMVNIEIPKGKLKQIERLRDVKNVHKTRIDIIVKPDKDLYNVRYIEEIPKCAVELIRKGIINITLLKFKNPDFEIIDEDPLLMWQFDILEAGEELDLSYEINRELVEDCIKQMKQTGLLLGQIKIPEEPVLAVPKKGVTGAASTLFTSFGELIDDNPVSAIIGSLSIFMIMGFAAFQIYFRGPVEKKLKKKH
jgi:hypothetical protein